MTPVAPASVRLLALAAIIVLVPSAAAAVCDVTTPGIAFGPYDVGNPAPTDSTGVISILCDETPVPLVTVAINEGLHWSGGTRRMTLSGGSGAYLSYNLYTDATATDVWGDGTGGTSTVSVRAKLRKNRDLTFYGRVPEGQDVPVGSYHDTLTVTITW
jgi:spore coat protein U-like protein